MDLRIYQLFHSHKYMPSEPIIKVHPLESTEIELKMVLDRYELGYIYVCSCGAKKNRYFSEPMKPSQSGIIFSDDWADKSDPDFSHIQTYKSVQ